MRQNLVSRVPFWVIALIAAGWSIAGHALVVSIDEFTITKNGGAFFTDSFADGNEPPSAPNFAGGNTATYNVRGTIPSTAEAGGVLQINSANGVVTANSIGTARIETRVRLQSNIDPTNLALGLKIDDTFTVTGRFDLVTPSGGFNPQYSVRLNDVSVSSAHQILQLQVILNAATGIPEVRYIIQDFDANTLITLASIPLTPAAGANEIALTLTRNNLSNSNILASFDYLADGLSLGGGTAFLTPGLAFQGENFVRAEFNVSDGFRAAAAVPEPVTIWLIAFALLALLVARRRAQL